MNYKVIDKEKYYRRGVYRHFTEDCKCSTSMTARIDVTELVKCSKEKNTKFYVNFLYILSKVLNSRDDYKMGYLWQTDELICYDTVNPAQYIFHEDTETCTPVYTSYNPDYETSGLDNVYYCADLDCFIVLEEDEIPVLQSVLCREKVALTDVVRRIDLDKSGFMLGFTPLEEDRDKCISEVYDGGDDYRLFYRGKKLESIEKDKLYFPDLSHA